MRLCVYTRHQKRPGVYTNDRDLIRYLMRSKDFQLWYIVRRKGKLDGAAFLYKYKGFIKTVKEIVTRWKRSRR